MATSYVGAAFFSAGTCSTPAGTVAGDGLVAFCANRLGATFPSTPAGWRAVFSVADGVAGISIIGFARRATGTDSFAFPSNCSQVTICTWRGVRPDVVGAAVIATSGGVALTPVTYPAIPSLQTAAPWVAEFSFTTNSTALPAAAPSGMTRRAANAVASPAGSSAVDDSNGPVTSAPAKTTTLSPTATWLSASVEILPVAANVPAMADASQVSAMVVGAHSPVTQASQLAALAVTAPPASETVEASQTSALVAYAESARAQVSQMAVLAVYSEGVPDPVRSRAWWFMLDGHAFYVLDLAEEGTYIYDMTTQQWARWYTDGYEGTWNAKTGTMWQGLRAVAGDARNGQTWVIDPTTNVDEGWRDVQHVVTGGIMLRGRVHVGMSSLSLAGSAGDITAVDGTAAITMRFSDDMGRTWSDGYAVTVTEGDFSEETAWRSLGSFANPGRIIEISDVGGTVRIDGLDANLDGFDEPPSPAMGG